MDKSVLYNFSYGVYLVTSVDGKRPVGCVANSAIQVTSAPSTVAVSINHDNYTNGCIDKSGYFGVTVLAEDTDPTLIGRFGFNSSKDTDKFNGLKVATYHSVPVMDSEAGYIVCKVVNKMETATHTVFLGEVVEAVAAAKPRVPMTYAYYHQVIKGKSPKNAPTYVAEEQKIPAKKAKWVCQVCGYIYEGDPLPDGFTCPVCGVGADRFKKEN